MNRRANPNATNCHALRAVCRRAHLTKAVQANPMAVAMKNTISKIATVKPISMPR
jgi:hypothetical protein